MKTPLGITIPIQRGSAGYFEQSFDISTQIRSNIINLLNTKPGERRMQPLFGTRLWNLVFEPNSLDFLQEKSKKVIEEDINRWIPNVSVIGVRTDLEQNTQNSDIYRLNLHVDFLINLTKQKDTVKLTIENIIS